MTSVGWVVCVLVVVPACFHPSYDHPACGPHGECPSGFVCSAQGTCEELPLEDLVLSGTRLVYDTGTSELTADGAAVPVPHMSLATKEGSVDAIVAHNVRLVAGVELRAIGTLPFAIVASGSITLEEGSVIDVSDGGAGAQLSCVNSPMPGGDNDGGGAGGGGGGYGTAGGKGGDGNGNGQPLDKTIGGTEGASIAMPMGLAGGCTGARGGKGLDDGGSMNGSGGPGGLGGGALYLVAADRIELGTKAALMAGGGGGRGGGQSGGTINSGGGGGGSGGMILLESPHVTGTQALVVANGGGGGEGADIILSNPPVTHAGKAGEAGLTSTSRASGGAGGAPNGTDGGHGGSLEVPVGEAVLVVLDSGGGGGGGGVGYIRIVSADVQLALVSPAAQ